MGAFAWGAVAPSNRSRASRTASLREEFQRCCVNVWRSCAYGARREAACKGSRPSRMNFSR